MSAPTESPTVTMHADRAGHAGLPRILPAPGQPPENWQAHLRRHGPVPALSAATLIEGLEASGLTGRGGAAFPVHRKLRAVREAAAKRHLRPVVVANGAESEPASDKDATLLFLAPHLVLDGLQLVAAATGADRAFLYTHADPAARHTVASAAGAADPAVHPASRRAGDLARRLERALAERRDAAGPVDDPADGPVDRVPVTLVTAPPRFLAGQETALVSHLGGGPAIPVFNNPRITERGLGGVPTLVQNVETLAHLALIARYGPRWFRAAGTPTEPGSMLCTLRTTDGRPRIFEIPLGTPLSEILGSDLNDAQAVLIGGYHGTWVPAARAARLRLDNESLSAVGAKVGAGIVLALPADRCGLVETARGVRYLALESAGQCGPCLNGLPRISAALTEMARGAAPERARASVERWAGLLPGRGACHHPDGTVRFVRSALETFAAELHRHERGQCGAARAAALAAPFLPIPASTARVEEDWL